MVTNMGEVYAKVESRKDRRFQREGAQVKINPENYETGGKKKQETLFHCYALLEYIYGKYKVEPSLKYTRDGIVGTTGVGSRSGAWE